jgi:hypothetical protein
MSDPIMEYAAAPDHFAHGDNHAQFVRALVKRGVKPEAAEHLADEIRDNPAVRDSIRSALLGQRETRPA